MSLESRIVELHNKLQEKPIYKQTDFERGVNEGSKSTLNFIVNGDCEVDVEMVRVEVKTDYSTMKDELSSIVDQYQDDENNYLNKVQSIFNSFIENLNNREPIEIDFNENTIDQLQELNDYKRAIVHGLSTIGIFIETVHSIESDKNDVFDSVNFDSAILDITDAYLEVSGLYLKRIKDKVNLSL